MLSEFMQKKYSHYFKLWDRDGDDAVRFEDFAQLLERIVQLTHLSRGSELYQLLYQNTVDLWAGMQRFADTNNDQTISLDEWLVYSEALLPMVKPMADANQPTPMGDFIFRFMDENQDGVVEVNAWSAFVFAWGIQDDPEQHFRWLDTNHDGKITYEEWSSLLYIWALSEDPRQSGNLLFGSFDRSEC